MESGQPDSSLISSFSPGLSPEAATAKIEDSSLIAAARADPAAFEPLYQKYLTPVYRYLCLRTASAEEAADLTQLVFIKAFTGLTTYRERGLPFAAWLFRIARNLATDAYRRHRPTVTLDKLAGETISANSGDPESFLLRQEDFQTMRELLVRLKPENRDLIALRFAAGLTTKEIAAVTGKKEEAVKKQLARTVRHLKEQYREQDQ